MILLFRQFIGSNLTSLKFAAIPMLLFILIFCLPTTGMADTVDSVGVPAATSTGHITDKMDMYPMDAAEKKVGLSIKAFLSTAFKGPSLYSQKERIRLLKETTTDGISFIEDPEFRFTIDRFEHNQQKYALRFKPRGWGEIKSEKAVKHAREQSGTVQLEYLVHMALKERYMSVVDFLYFSEMKSLHDSLKLVYEDWAHVLKRQVGTSDFDAGELADMENQRMALQLDIMELNTQQDALTKNINQQSGFGTDVFLDACRPLSVDLLADRILSVHGTTGDENIHLTRAKIETAEAEAQYQLEAAEQNRLISFVETSYNAADEDDIADAFSFEFGISIPIGSGRDGLRQRKLESMKSKSRQQVLESEIEQTTLILCQQLQNQIEQYQVFQQKKANSFSKTAFDHLLGTKGADPLTLLKLKKGMIEMDILQTRLTRKIFITYIELLDITGKLSKRPLMNYLSLDAWEGLVQ